MCEKEQLSCWFFLNFWYDDGTVEICFFFLIQGLMGKVAGFLMGGGEISW